jgi:hypothetical protein
MAQTIFAQLGADWITAIARMDHAGCSMPEHVTVARKAIYLCAKIICD